jgi:hypothetical protein
LSRKTGLDLPFHFRGEGQSSDRVDVSCVKRSPSSFFDWANKGREIETKRANDEAVIVAEIRAADLWSDGTCGAVKIQDRLDTLGRTVSVRRVAELMRKHRICGVSGRLPTMRTTLHDDYAGLFDDLVERRFQPCRPDVVWYAISPTFGWTAGSGSWQQ